MALTVGVVSDTHIPDRVQQLHPQLLPALQAARVSAILHAGDIAVPRVLEQLETVAPVFAVRGNRDWAFRRSLPWARQLEFNGTTLALVHGHGTWMTYLLDKWKYLTEGYNLKRYMSIMARMVHGAKVVVFGHTHKSENLWHEGKLWFNPGSATIANWGKKEPSYGLLHFSEEGEVSGEIIGLTGARLELRRWIIL